MLEHIKLRREQWRAESADWTGHSWQESAEFYYIIDSSTYMELTFNIQGAYLNVILILFPHMLHYIITVT